MVFSHSVGAVRCEHYLGRDRLPNLLSETYRGLSNPDHNPVSLLYADTYPAPGSGGVSDWTVNRYRCKRIYTYPAPNLGRNTKINEFKATFGISDILPRSLADHKLELTPSSGPFAGEQMTGGTSSLACDYNNLRVRSVDALAGFATRAPENCLHTSSADRWSDAMTGASIRMHIESIDPELSIRDSTGALVLPRDGAYLDLGNGSIFGPAPIVAIDDKV